MEMLRDPEFWVGVGFVLVIALLVWKGVPGMVGKMLDQRAAVIAAELDEARRLRDEAAALLADYQKQGRRRRSRSRRHPHRGRAPKPPASPRKPAPHLKAQIARRAQAAQDKIAQAEAAAMNEIRAPGRRRRRGAAQKLIAARMDEKRAGGLIAEASRIWAAS